MTRGMIQRQRAPAAMLYGHERAVALRLKAHIRDGLFARLEVHAAPFELETRGRLPHGHAPDLDRARPCLQLERFEQPPALAGFEVQLSAALTSAAIARTALPPQSLPTPCLLRQPAHVDELLRRIVGIHAGDAFILAQSAQPQAAERQRDYG
jgi:hypothetical protein